MKTLTENSPENRTEFFNPFSLSLKKNPHDSVRSMRPAFSHRGVNVYKRFPCAYVYLVDGICVSERVGYSQEAIDTMLDGKDAAGNLRPWERERYEWALETGRAGDLVRPFV